MSTITRQHGCISPSKVLFEASTQGLEAVNSKAELADFCVQAWLSCLHQLQVAALVFLGLHKF